MFTGKVEIILTDRYKILETGQNVSYDVEQTGKDTKSINVMIQ